MSTFILFFSKVIVRNSNRNIVAITEENNQSPKFPPEFKIRLLKDT